MTWTCWILYKVDPGGICPFMFCIKYLFTICFWSRSVDVHLPQVNTISKSYNLNELAWVIESMQIFRSSLLTISSIANNSVYLRWFATILTITNKRIVKIMLFVCFWSPYFKRTLSKHISFHIIWPENLAAGSIRFFIVINIIVILRVWPQDILYPFVAKMTRHSTTGDCWLFNHL